jgi:hypothetical protein
MVTKRIKMLKKLKRKVARFESEVADEIRYELANLPERYGFESHTSFLKAVKEAYGKARFSKRGKSTGSGR